MSSSRNFFNWLKSSTLVNPSRRVDQKIYQLVSTESTNISLFSYSRYFIISTALAAGLILVFTSSHLSNIQGHPISESPELLAYYDQVELMSQAAQLSEKEWEMIIKEEQR